MAGSTSGSSRMLEWKINEALAVGKGATVQEFVATVGNDRIEIDVAPWGEGHLKVNGREIAHIDDAKDRRQALRAIKRSQSITWRHTCLNLKAKTLHS